PRRCRAAGEALALPDRRRGARGARPPDDGGPAEIPARRRTGTEGARFPARVSGRIAARPDGGWREEARRHMAPHTRGGGARARPSGAGGARARSVTARRDLRGRVAPAAFAPP